MLGLPESTELKRIITKKKVFDHFGAEITPERRKRFDSDIARMVLTNEISPFSVNLAPGETVQNFFVLHISLKEKDFDPQNIAYISKLFGQRLVMVLDCDGQQRLALWQTKLIMTEWATPDELALPLTGLDLDKVWENIVTRIAGIELVKGRSLDEAIANAALCEKLRKDIARLEKLARAEKQPKRKFELVQQLKAQREKLEEISHG